ncbi:MAG: hypothetical protein ACXABY_05520 [Candidatus Thorarchaeota archaeon]|jgi:hypothetical protein
MVKMFISKEEAKKAPEIKGRGAEKMVLAILSIVAILYAVASAVITLGYTVTQAALIFIIFGIPLVKKATGKNSFKWEYALMLGFSVYAMIGNLVWSIPVYLDLIGSGWAVTILLEPVIAIIAFGIIAVICYDLAFRSGTFKSWTT